MGVKTELSFHCHDNFAIDKSNEIIHKSPYKSNAMFITCGYETSCYRFLGWG